MRAIENTQDPKVPRASTASNNLYSRVPRVIIVLSTIRYPGYSSSEIPGVLQYPEYRVQALSTSTEYFGYPRHRLSKILRIPGYFGYPLAEIPGVVPGLLSICTEYAGYRLPRILSISGYPGYELSKILRIPEYPGTEAPNNTQYSRVSRVSTPKITQHSRVQVPMVQLVTSKPSDVGT